MKTKQQAAKRRSIKAAKLILQGNTVRDVADMLGMSKTQIHKDVTYNMKEYDLDLYRKVQAALANNKQEGYRKAGEALAAMTRSYKRNPQLEEAVREKAVQCAQLVVNDKLTIREVCSRLDMSRATVHVYLTKQLPKWYPFMAEQVKRQLAINLKEGRSLGGYNSTKRGTK
jgi:DNA invertase Pin-like site-specific DNA recombinase